MDTALKLIPVFLLLALVVNEIWRAVLKPALTFQLPFLVSATFAVMILPTLIANTFNDAFLTTSEFLRFSWFAFACMFAAIFTYKRTKKVGTRVDRADSNIPGQLLGFSLLPFLLVALLSTTQVNPTEYGSIHGGSFAIFLFFARLLRPVQILAWGGYLQTRSKNCLAVFVVCVAATLPFIFISGRRSDALFLPLSILVPLWALRGKTPSGRQIVAGILFVLGVFFLLPVVRMSTRDFHFSDLASIRFGEELQRAIVGERTNEVIEVAKDMAAVEYLGEYSYGVEFVNKITHQYVSATIFGEEVKAAFRLPQPDLDVVRAAASNGKTSYSENKAYLTRFGFGDGFLAFGWFGVLYFIAFGFLVAKIFDFCFRSKDARLRLAYCVFVVFIPFTIYDSFSACPELLLPWMAIVWFTLVWVPKRLIVMRRSARQISKVSRCLASS